MARQHAIDLALLNAGIGQRLVRRVSGKP